MKKFYFSQTNEEVVDLFDAMNFGRMMKMHEQQTEKEVTFHIVSSPLMEYREGELQVVPFVAQETDTAREFVFSIESVREVAKAKDKYIVDVITDEMTHLNRMALVDASLESLYYVPVKSTDDLEGIDLYVFEPTTCKFNLK